MSRIDDPEAAYRSDAAFHHLVDAMEAMLERAEFTPSEMRAAAVLACTHREMKLVRPMIYPLPPVIPFPGPHGEPRT